MAKTVPIEDKRLELISEQLVNFANGDFNYELPLSEERDSIDSIIVGLNLVGEELKCHIDEVEAREKELKISLDRLNEAQQLARIGSWEWHIPENKIEWTDELYRLYGLERASSQASYEKYLQLIHPEDADFVNNQVQKAYQDHQPFDFFHRIIRPDGSTRILHSRGTVLLNDEGAPVKMTGTAQDVTEKKQSEEKNHILASIVESSSDAIISKTLSGIVTSWNKTAEKLFGYTRDEIMGKHISILFPEDRLSEETTLLKEIKEGKVIMNYETQRKRKDGSHVHVAITISPIYNTEEQIIGVSKIVRDITDKKFAEERLQRYIQELEYKNNETRQFAYVASHDLQEPLRTIGNYIKLLAEDYKGKLDSNADIYINFISNGATRMQRLVHDLLEYTRIENDAKIEDIDLNHLVKNILESMRLILDETKAEVTVGELPVISGYETRLTSLFQNLINNAIKFRKTEVPPVIEISAEDKGRNWLFTVKDNGIGIEKEYFDRIFMLFQRLHPRSKYDGTGIGLAHCKKIVELRGGKIWVESTPGLGSSFFISLPKRIIL
jgi:PAS domain S-box-containing protein